MDTETKHCKHCDLDLPRSQFYNDKKTKGGLTAYCREYYKDYYANNRERQLATTRKAQIKRRYGLEWSEYQRLLLLGCNICGSMERLHVDHNHATGATRGVLCGGCNVVLGHAKECPARLRKIADWIENPPSIAQELAGQAY